MPPGVVPLLLDVEGAVELVLPSLLRLFPAVVETEGAVVLEPVDRTDLGVAVVAAEVVRSLPLALPPSPDKLICTPGMVCCMTTAGTATPPIGIC